MQKPITVICIVMTFAFLTPQSVVAQLGVGGLGGGAGGGLGGGATDSNPASGPTSIGGGGGLTLNRNIPTEIVKWETPSGPLPSWLTSGKKSIEAVDRLRDSLRNTIDVDFNEKPLKEVLIDISELGNIPIYVDEKTIEQYSGTETNAPVTLNLSGSTHQILRSILEPMDLTVVVRENWVEISNSDNLVCRTYDLSYIQNSSKNLLEIINSIEASVSPDSWLNNGGEGSCLPFESLLIINASEFDHFEIEKLLSALARPRSVLNAPGLGGQNADKK